MKTLPHYSFAKTWAAVLLLTSTVFSGCSSTGSGVEGEGLEGNGALSESDLNAQREARFGSGSIPSAEGSGLFADVNFGYDSYSVDSFSRQVLDENARILRERPDLKVTLEGHCDERGTVDYNMALGAERARAIKSELVAMGIPASRLETITYGEEVPLDPGTDEDAWAKNRRVHFSATNEAPRGRATR